jgi:glycogen(starch) synthase
LRVLIWSEIFWPYIGGAEIIAAALGVALKGRGHEVAILTAVGQSDPSGEDSYEGIPIHRFDIHNAFANGRIGDILSITQQVSALKREFRPDVIHMNSFGPSALVFQNTIAAGRAPLLLTLQLDIAPSEDTGPSSIAGKLFRTADWVTGVSEEVLRQFRERVPEMTERSSVVYNAVEVPSVDPKPLPFDEPRILCLGRAVEQKGFDVALRAWARIRDRFPRARMVIAGDGVTRGDLERLAGSLGVRDSIDFLGWVAPAKVASLINTATMVVMPSRREGLPLVAVEAAHMGRPIVGTRVTGMTEAVVSGETGLLVEAEDVDAVANSIVYLLENPETTRRLGRAARSRALENFDWQRSVDAYCELYEKLAKEAVHEEFALSAA